MTCSVDGCDREVRAKGMCSMHHSRMVRTGTTDPRPRLNSKLSKDGYREVHALGHPLARRNGDVLEHRKVVYDAGIPVPDGYVVHHINGDKLDNRLENLDVLSPSEHSLRHVAEKDTIVNHLGTWQKQAGRVCFLDDCDKAAWCRGLCNRHYSNWQQGFASIPGFEQKPRRNKRRAP